MEVRSRERSPHLKAQAPIRAPETQSAPGRSDVVRQAPLEPAFADNRPGATAQLALADALRHGPHVVAQRQQLRGMFGDAAQFEAGPAAARNTTGLPDGLKSGVESLSGMSMDGVKVHYNSAQPAELNALAYAQGSDIHVAPGQEQHLPHEAWHVVQQAQGRVQPTMQMRGAVPVNDDAGLEHEADVMGARALTPGAQLQSGPKTENLLQGKFAPVQRFTEEKRTETDTRMDELYEQAVAVLTSLQQTGTDWKKEYGEKGREKGKEKAKSVLSGEKSDPTSEIIREGLSRYWATLTPEEKLELVGEAAKKVGQGAKLLANAGLEASRGSGGSKEKEKEPEKEKPRNEPKKKSDEESSFVPSIGWLNELTSEDLETLYDAYKTKRKIMSKIAEIQEKITEGAGDIGEFVGSTVGGIKADVEFSEQCAKHRQNFLVARTRFEFLRGAIASNGDAERYASEMDALQYALFNIHGPAMVYFLGGLDEKGRLLYPERCETALENLKSSHLWRGGKARASGLVAAIGSGLRSILGIGAEQDQKALTSAQKEMATELTRVANKSWRKFTSGLFAFTPTGVSSIRDALTEGSKPTDKISKAIQAASEAKSKASDKRDPMTQIFYDAVAELKVDDINNLKKSVSIIQEVGAKLG
jgi:hypothetical protein